jgi:hypothetical protein
LALLLASVQASRHEVSGVEFRALVEEYADAPDASPRRLFEEHFVVLPHGASIAQTYTIAAGVVGNVQPTSITRTAAFDGDVAFTWDSSSIEAVFVGGKSSLPRFSPQYSSFAAWFPVPYNAPGTGPVDLESMLLSGEFEVAPYTQTVDGAVCIVVRTPADSWLSTTLWLDPDRSYFPRLHRVEDDLGVIAEWHVEEFASVGGVSWVPSAGRFWHRADGSGLPGDVPVVRRLSLLSEPMAPSTEDLIAVPAGSTVVDATAASLFDPAVGHDDSRTAAAGASVIDASRLAQGAWIAIVGAVVMAFGAVLATRTRRTPA